MSLGEKSFLSRLLLVAGFVSLLAGIALLLLTTPKWFVAVARVRVARQVPTDVDEPWVFAPYGIQREFDLLHTRRDIRTPARPAGPASAQRP